MRDLLRILGYYSLFSRVANMKLFRVSFAALLLVGGALTLAACNHKNQGVDERGGFTFQDSSNCLPDIPLIDQHGQKVTLASLKGKPVIFDFIYTSCPGPCLLLTARMKRIADDLGPRLGDDVRIISISVDPEHDHPAQLLKYARDRGAERRGWLFLTGSPKQIDDVMSRFKLTRERESDGSVAHVLEFFLVTADGHAVAQYLGDKADPQRVAGDLERAAEGKPLTTARWISGLRRALLS
jgi:cytochrome oxidase Cu insertion factor (SCO1/SenC/PrrC family)